MILHTITDTVSVTKKKKKSKKKLSYKKLLLAGLFILVLFILTPTVYSKVRFLIKYGFYTEAMQRDNLAVFGVVLPKGYNIHGIDISHHQKEVDWENIATINVNGNCIKFAFIKATEGITRQDLHYQSNWKKSKEAGLIRGAYHYYYPTRDAKKQADNFIHEVKLSEGDLPPVLDIELSKGKSKQDIVKGALEWCDAIEEHYGVKPIIYTNPVFYDKYLKDDFEDYPLWIAHYYEEKPKMQHREWIFWQHTDCAIINGIDKPVDLNVFNGDIEDLNDLCLQK
jgi:lysozyme